jgi:hypothetical protein
MSSLKVDTVQNRSGGAVTLTKQEAFKHYAHYNHKTDTVVKSFNLSSINDDAEGEYTVTIASAMNDINSVFTCTCNFDADGQPDAAGGQLHSDNSTGNEVAPTTSAYKVRTDGHNSAAKDLKYNYTALVGDLA